MSDMAKQARAAMKAKASRLTTADPHQKVDSSTWTPPEALNTEAKTGLRPISRRAFKKGGKVVGKKPKMNLGKSTRGGNKPITPDNFANKDVKAANEDRAGIKHIGALKRGGKAMRKGREEGGETTAERERKQKMLLSDPRPGSEFDTPEKMAAENKRRQGTVWDQVRLAKGGKTMRKGKAGGGYSAMADYHDEDAVPYPDRPEKADMIGELLKNDTTPAVAGKGPLTKSQAGIKPGGGTPAERAANRAAFEKEQREYQRKMPQNQKAGGKVKKALGGSMAGAKRILEQGQETSGVPAATMGFSGLKKGLISPARGIGLKKGGTAKHDDVKEDMALIKKMVKPSARKGRKEGGGIFTGPGYPGKVPGVVPGGRIAKAGGGGFYDPAVYIPEDDIQAQMGRNRYIARGAENGRDIDLQHQAPDRYIGLSPKYSPERAIDMIAAQGRRKDMAADDEASSEAASRYRKSGGRTGRATGGKAGKGKGKTNINIVIAAGKQPGQDMMGPPPGMDAMTKGMPVPVGMPPGAGGMPMGGGAPPMPMLPMPAPGGAPMGGPPGMPPMPRKSGGRLTAKASSYKDMTAGSAGGEGRLQKTDIAEKHKGAPAFKAGGGVYRSYKDMDAGSASGLGRLEKTEIQKRKS